MEEILRKDYFLNPHYRYYIREMKILAYTQLLESYRSLTLQYMSEAFGVSMDFIDEWVIQIQGDLYWHFWHSNYNTGVLV